MSLDAGSTDMGDERTGHGDAELGFQAAVIDGADTAARSAAVARPGRRARAGVRRKLGGLAVVAGALISVGGGYALLAPSSGAADTTTSSADIQAGRQLFEATCITCHGQNLQGVMDRGPSLIGTGSASVYFQVSTGRMPLARQSAEADRKPSKFTDLEVRQLAAYVQSVGGGPALPSGTSFRTTSDAQLSEGGELFRLNCASCHNFAGKGAPLSAGKVAPSLSSATDLQIYTAMLSGPENMPVFSNNSITPEQKTALITYIQTLKNSPDAGGASLGRLGPLTEGLVIMTVGLGVLIVAIFWIGAKA